MTLNGAGETNPGSSEVELPTCANSSANDGKVRHSNISKDSLGTLEYRTYDSLKDKTSWDILGLGPPGEDFESCICVYLSHTTKLVI